MIYPLGLTGTLYPLGLHPGLILGLRLLKCIPCIHLDNLAPALDLTTLAPALAVAAIIAGLNIGSIAPNFTLEGCDCD
jgi:hypothetical protein